MGAQELEMGGCEITRQGSPELKEGRAGGTCSRHRPGIAADSWGSQSGSSSETQGCMAGSPPALATPAAAVYLDSLGLCLLLPLSRLEL